jgi:hypothetical protein
MMLREALEVLGPASKWDLTESYEMDILKRNARQVLESVNFLEKYRREMQEDV